MTCLISWLSVDSTGPSAIYVGADSRISWKGSTEKWDICQKVFCCKNSPDIFGYSGDSLFATQVLSHAVDMADSGLLFNDANNPYEKQVVLSQFIKDCFHSHPKYPEFPEFTIIFCTRNDEEKGSVEQFKCFSLAWNKKKGLQEFFHPLPITSGPIVPSGTGGEYFSTLYKKNCKVLGENSRAVFMTLCDVITKGLDPQSGGQPQLVGIYRGGNGKVVGTIYNGKRFFLGTEISVSNPAVAIEWRNENFERCDGVTLELLGGAQKQPRPTEVDQNADSLRARGIGAFMEKIRTQWR